MRLALAGLGSLSLGVNVYGSFLVVSVPSMRSLLFKYLEVGYDSG